MCSMVRTTCLLYGPDQVVVIKGRDAQQVLLDSPDHDLHTSLPHSLSLRCSLLPQKQPAPVFSLTPVLLHLLPHLTSRIPLPRQFWPSVVLLI